MSELRKSGYERSTLLELRIARLAAWTLYLVAVGLLVAVCLGKIDVAWWKFFIAEVLIWVAAGSSAKCEYKAEKQLKDIWEAELLDRTVNG